MNKRFSTFTAAAVILGMAGTAGAVPISFDFTGTVTYVGYPSFPPPAELEARVGQTVSGGFTFETDRLFAAAPGSQPLSQNYVDFGNPGADASRSYLNIGGTDIAFPQRDYQYYSIGFNDACSPAPPTCTPQWAEAFVLYGFTSDLPFDLTGVTGEFTDTSLLYLSMVPMVTDPNDPFVLIPAFDYVNLLEGSDPTDILSLPLYQQYASLQETLWSCVDGACNSASYSTSFTIESVTRGVVAVPEPGTLALFAVGLAGLALMRRPRRASAQSRFDR